MSGLFSRRDGSGPGGGQRPLPPPGGRSNYERVPDRVPVPPGGGGGDYGQPNPYDGQRNPYGRAPPSGYQDEKAEYRQPPVGLPGGPRMQSGGPLPPAPRGQQQHVGGGGGMPGAGAPRSSGRMSGSGFMGGPAMQMRPAKSPSNEFTFGNLCAVSQQDFPQKRVGEKFYIILNESYVLTAKVSPGFPPRQLSLSDAQRTWASISLQDEVSVRECDPYSEGANSYCHNLDLNVSFAGKKSTAEQIDQDELAAIFIRNYENQVFSPKQRLIMDYKSIPMLFVVQSISLGDPNMASSAEPETLSIPTARGILTKESQIGFFKDAKSEINLKASKRRPAANAILAPNFKFEDMGIGGLDKEFSAIFRRAFASRIFPPGLIQNMGVQHVRGILLFGPPGTGKTLIARKIGQMLNAREPKVINGPEVLNKFVGQSEENIRKLFADAEKEYKEKGEESGLHIIIFDELDAVCKQRGSGAGGGTGVGDSVVNQLLSKLDGVDQLNNILLIGMTNRKDMIDDALLRPGRLEVHMEISLPDEYGRVQILKIHTAQMSKHGNLDPDVSLEEIAHRTKNFSGAELSGLVRAATSNALSRHVKVGTMASVSDDIDNITVNRSDFEGAFEDVKPAFGVSEDELAECLQRGIIHYSPYIDQILEEGRLLVQQVQGENTPLYAALIHGPPGSGKTALAAKMALDSGFPFIKLCSPNNMVGFNESMKIEQMRRVFEDAYKSPLSVVVVDNIERLLGYVPVGPRFDNAVLQNLIVLLKKQPPKGRRLLVLATTSQLSIMHSLDLYNSFSSDIAVPTVQNLDELGYILQDSQAFPDVNQALMELQAATGQHDGKVGVGIKKILLAIETARQDKADMSGRFAKVVSRLVFQNGSEDINNSSSTPGRY